VGFFFFFGSLLPLAADRRACFQRFETRAAMLTHGRMVFVHVFPSTAFCLDPVPLEASALARRPLASPWPARIFRRGLWRGCDAGRSSSLLIKGAQLIVDRVQF
jgi:hypothetical protein